jgi:hypothetical protein
MVDVDGSFVGSICDTSSAAYSGKFEATSIFDSKANYSGEFVGGGATIVVHVPVENIITYVKRGYYVAGAAFEYWKTLVSTAPPPSGHPLLDVTIIQTIVTSI